PLREPIPLRTDILQTNEPLRPELLLGE
ncbi:MAG: hypothetical protein QOF94_1455, partial [Acidobacteriaceae bacterium]